MSNANERAYPAAATEHCELNPGLSKREYFAAQALTGLGSTIFDAILQIVAANPDADDRTAEKPMKIAAEVAVVLADATLKALEGKR